MPAIAIDTAATIPPDHARSSSLALDSPIATPSQRSSAVNSTTSLILVHDDELEAHSPLYIPDFDDSDNDADSDDDDYYIPHDQRPLPPSNVILLLLAPCLRLGAILLPSVVSASLAISIPCLLLAAALAAFVRHLWVLLAHYVRKVSVEDIFCEALARLRIGRSWKTFTKGVVRTGGVFIRCLLVTLYLHVIIISIGSALPPHQASLPVLAALIFLALVLISPSTATTTSPRVVFLTLLSGASYVTWVTLLIHARLSGNIPRIASIGSFVGLTTLWDTFTASLVVFAGFPPLTIYAGLSKYRFPTAVVGGLKVKKRTSFGTLSIIATVLALLMTFPLLLLIASEGTAAQRDKEYTTPAIQITRGLTLLFAVPEAFSTMPRVPWVTAQASGGLPRALITQLVPRTLLLLICTVAAFLPYSYATVIASVLLIAILLSTYLLPAALHVLFHHLFPPTSIVVPGYRARSAPSTSDDEEAQAHTLLLAKERALQRRRLLRRLFWDILVWVVLAGAVVLVVWKLRRMYY